MLLPWGNTSIIGHLVSQWRRLPVRQVGVVCAVQDEKLRSELDRIGFSATDRITNPAPERGMFSSIQCAAIWAGWRAELSHWIIVLGDQPQVRLETLAGLLRFAVQKAEPVCQPAVEGRRRHPVILCKEVFSELRKTRCHTLKEFLAPRPTALWESDDAGLAWDLDRPEDYSRALAQFRT